MVQGIEVYAFLVGLGLILIGAAAVRWADRRVRKRASSDSDFTASLAAAVIAGGGAMSVVSVAVWLIG